MNALDLTDPRHNARELCKQLLLLEDHLAHPDKRCPDCVRKHFMFAEAFADEGVALAPDGPFAHTLESAGDMCRSWIASLIDGADPAHIAAQLRLLRKDLTPEVFDPR